MKRYNLTLSVFLVLSGVGTAGGVPNSMYDHSDPVDLPELLRTFDGRKVESVGDWEGIRRPELLDFFSRNVYGMRPVERPTDLRFEPIGDDVEFPGIPAVRKRVRVKFSGPRGAWGFDACVFVPKSASSGNPVPAFLLICNRALDRFADVERKVKSDFFPVEEIVRRGYAAAVFKNTELALDSYYPHFAPDGTAVLQDPPFTNGFYACWAKERTETSWGAISAWAWGASRVLDWLGTLPEIDAGKVAVVGHSRGGKTALWAAASDSRFAMACVNDSGCCGAKLNHVAVSQSETIRQDNAENPHWFCRAFRRFDGRDAVLPYDQHWIAALVAPRFLYISSASEDMGAGPWGEFLTARHASSAWELYGRKGLVEDHPYCIEKPFHGGCVGYHLRQGDHGLALYDWSRFMDFADRHLKDRASLVLHLDFNTLQHDRAALLGLIRRAAADGYNAILWEIENKVRFDCCPEAIAPDAYTKAEFREILAESVRLGMEPIPLMQTFGHAEWVLKCSRWEHLREVPDRDTCYCPSRPETRAFQKTLLLEYLDLFGKDVRRFHLGGDEAWEFGKCPVCSRRDRMELYSEHLESLARILRERGIRPGCWHDMVFKFENGKQGRFPKDYTLWYWNYSYPDKDGDTGEAEALDLVRELVRSGRETIFCASSQSWRDDPFMVRYGMHRRNLAGGAELARREGLAGFCVTSWTIHQGLKGLQLPLFELAARRYLGSGIDAEDEWLEIVRRNFGDVPLAALDGVSEWSLGFEGAEGRGWYENKDGEIPPTDGFAARFKNERGKLMKMAEIADGLAVRTKKALDGLKRSKLTERGRLVVEAGELKVLFLEALSKSLRGERNLELPLARAEAFYSHAYAPWSARRATDIIFALLREHRE